jgi:hypothetical protein
MEGLRIGDVIARSFSILFRNFAAFTFLTALVYAPLLVLEAVLPMEEGGAAATGLAVLSMVFYTVASATVIYGVLEQLRGQRASVMACIAVGLQQIVPVLGASIVLVVCMLFGLVVLVIPGIIVLLMLFVTVPVAVIERPGITGALDRSSELTRGYKLQILGICLPTWLLVFGLSWLAGAIEDAFGGGAGFFASLATQVFTGALGAVNTAVVYHDLRTIKDGVNVDALVRVFE